MQRAQEKDVGIVQGVTMNKRSPEKHKKVSAFMPISVKMSQKHNKSVWVECGVNISSGACQRVEIQKTKLLEECEEKK